MTTVLTAPRLAAVAAFAGLLLLVPTTQAEARGGTKTARAATGAYGYKPPPVVRDHRQNPQPWALPRHYHRH